MLYVAGSDFRGAVHFNVALWPQPAMPAQAPSNSLVQLAGFAL